MRLSDLQNKKIVNINDGKNVGNIIDVNVTETGNIESLIIEQTKTNSNVTYELSGISSYNIYSGEILTFNVIFKTSNTT